MGKLTLASAKTGELTASFGTFRIHSAYDPTREAARFLESRLNDFRRNGTVVIVGAGLAYLDTQLAAKRPDLRIVSCHLVPEIYDHHIGENASVNRWNPKDEVEIEGFLFETIGELDIPGLRIIEWPASIQAAPAMALEVKDALSRVIRRYSGNITTTAAFGRLWIRNTIRNFLELNQFTVPQEARGVTVIAASGPSLENHLEDLTRYRSHFHLWALPSSLAALTRAKIEPDLVFSTDPGHWARLHGRFFPPGTPVVMPLTAAPPPPHSGPPILLAQRSIGEDSLLTEDGWSLVHVPQTGSVVITAIETWCRISRGPLLLAGLDLCWFDLRSHVRPHSFDGWFSTLNRRTMPSLTTRWNTARSTAPKRDGLFRTGFSMTTYADWFKSARFKAPVYRLTAGGRPHYPNHLHNIEDADSSIFKRVKPVDRGRHPVRPAPIASEERKKKVCLLLRQWSELSAVPPELFYALDPRGILDMIRSGSASEKDWSDHRRRVRETIRELLQTYE